MIDVMLEFVKIFTSYSVLSVIINPVPKLHISWYMDGSARSRDCIDVT